MINCFRWRKSVEKIPRTDAQNHIMFEIFHSILEQGRLFTCLLSILLLLHSKHSEQQLISNKSFKPTPNVTIFRLIQLLLIDLCSLSLFGGEFQSDFLRRNRLSNLTVYFANISFLVGILILSPARGGGEW